MQQYKMQKRLEKKNMKKEVPIERKKKTDSLFEIEGNQNLAKIQKLELKKKKKEQARRGTQRENIYYFNIQIQHDNIIIMNFKISFC